MKLDFSQFHPLDHWPGSPRCRSFYGGTLHHVKTTWEFRRREQVVGWGHRALLRCPRGKHSIRLWHRANTDEFFAACKYCGFRRDVTDEERATFEELRLR